MINTGIELDRFQCFTQTLCFIGQFNEPENCVFLRNEKTGGIIW